MKFIAFMLILCGAVSAQESGWYRTGHIDTVQTKVLRAHPQLDVLFYVDGYVVREAMVWRQAPGVINPNPPEAGYWTALRFLDANKDTLPAYIDKLNKCIWKDDSDFK